MGAPSQPAQENKMGVMPVNRLLLTMSGPTMVSMLTIAISSRYIGPTKTAVLGVFEPLTAILIGTLMFGETLTAKMATGIAVCVAAVVFMIVKPGK